MKRAAEEAAKTRMILPGICIPYSKERVKIYCGILTMVCQ